MFLTTKHGLSVTFEALKNSLVNQGLILDESVILQADSARQPCHFLITVLSKGHILKISAYGKVMKKSHANYLLPCFHLK